MTASQLHSITGHNGLRDIEAALGTSSYSRLSLGIGRGGGRTPLVDFVLEDFSSGELRQMEQILERAEESVNDWLRNLTTTTINKIAV